VIGPGPDLESEVAPSKRAIHLVIAQKDEQSTEYALVIELRGPIISLVANACALASPPKYLIAVSKNGACPLPAMLNSIPATKSRALSYSVLRPMSCIVLMESMIDTPQPLKLKTKWSA
jgi:hypothetical protein